MLTHRKLLHDARLMLDKIQQAGILSQTAIAPTIAAMDTAMDPQTNSQDPWGFIMNGPDQLIAVVERIAAETTRPMTTTRVWFRCFKHIRVDTNEIMLTRQQIADQTGELPRHISSIMTELEAIGAISREKNGRGVRYFLNPLIGTHMTGKARANAQAKATPLRLV